VERGTLIAEPDERVSSETASEKTIDISVLIPISERHDDLRELFLQYKQALPTNEYAYEFVFVVDGPQGEALQQLQILKKEYPEIRVLVLNRCFGEATALSIGFDRVRGNVILTLASYFQVEPDEVQRLVKKLFEENVDLIISWRYPRIDSVFNRLQARVFHWITKLLTGLKYHDISCGLRVMKRKVAEEVALYGDLHRFFPLLAYQRGFKVVEVPVRQSRYDVKRRLNRPGLYLRRLLDLLTLFFLFKFTKKPLRFFGLVGSGLFGAGTLITGYLGLYRLLGMGGIADRPLLILGVLLMVLGVQLFSVGLLGEIVIFNHRREDTEYQIEEILE